jgi:hypothetical protein
VSPKILSATGNKRRSEDVLVPDTPERRQSHVSYGIDTGHSHGQVVVGEAARPFRNKALFARKTAVSRVHPDNAETVKRPCDYCRRNNKSCRIKLSGTCFNCAARKKKCKYSFNSPLSMIEGSTPMPTDTAAGDAQCDILQSSANYVSENATLAPTGAQDRSRLGSHDAVHHRIEQRRATPTSYPRTLSAPGSPGDAPHSPATSSVEEDFDLPPSRTIRRSSLIQRGRGN